MKTKLSLFLLLLTSLSTSAHASGSFGAGGQSIICQRSEEHEFFVESYDTFEGSYLFGYIYKQNQNAPHALSLALNTAARFDGLVDSPIRLTERIRRIAMAIKNSEAYPQLPLTGDIAPFYLPSGCELVQTLVFQQDGSIQVNKLAWDRLDTLGQAALYLHEAIYWHLRDTKREIDSRRTRRIVSYLLNGGELRDAPDAMNTFDATPVQCLSPGSQVFLSTDPGGKLALIAGSRFRGDYSRSILNGTLPGASLVEGGEFRASGAASFEGSANMRPLKLQLDGAQAFLTVINFRYEEKTLKLACRPYLERLP